MIKNLIDFIVQVFLDFMVGMASFFGLSAIFPNWNAAVVVAIAMMVAVVFAERLEVKLKK